MNKKSKKKTKDTFEVINNDVNSKKQCHKVKSYKSVTRLHLGKNETVRVKDIIGFFDLDGATESEATKDFLKRAEKEYRIINLLYDLMGIDVEPRREYIFNHVDFTKITE